MHDESALASLDLAGSESWPSIRSSTDVDRIGGRSQRASTRFSERGLEHALVLWVGASHDELASLQFLQHGVHALGRHEGPTSEVGVRETGLVIQGREDGELGHGEIARPQRVGHRVVQDRLRPLYQVAHPGRRDLVHHHLIISLPDILSGCLI